jgi:hypothetical protein
MRSRGIEMTNRIADISQRKAVTVLRILYPIWAVVGLFSIMYVPTTLIVPGDVTTTANNIMANELLFRMGIIGSLVTQVIQIFVVLLLYKLLKPVNKNYAVLMVVFALVGIPIAMLNTLNRVAALVLLNGADYLKLFGADHLHTLVKLFLDLNEQGVFIASIFWGLWLLPLGYLVYKSGYFPRILGVFLIIGGFGYLLDSFTHFILPNYANYEAIFVVVIPLLTIGELLFMGWVVLKGANLPEMESSN